MYYLSVVVIMNFDVVVVVSMMDVDCAVTFDVDDSVGLHYYYLQHYY